MKRFGALSGSLGLHFGNTTPKMILILQLVLLVIIATVTITTTAAIVGMACVAGWCLYPLHGSFNFILTTTHTGGHYSNDQVINEESEAQRG